MRRTEPILIGDIWQEFLNSAPGVARKIAEAKIPDIWPMAAGSTIASYTTAMNLHKGVLYVKVGSSVARNELFMKRESLKNEINRILGMQIVNVIIVK